MCEDLFLDEPCQPEESFTLEGAVILGRVHAYLHYEIMAEIKTGGSTAHYRALTAALREVIWLECTARKAFPPVENFEHCLSF